MKISLNIKSIFIVAILVIACSRTNEDRPAEEKEPKKSSETLLKNDSLGISEKNSDSIANQSNESFDTFYKKFTTDFGFQDSRIKYPLEGLYYNSSMGDVDDASYTWTRNDSLKYDLSDLDKNVYKVERDKSDSLIIEKIYIENSGFQMESHFKLIDSKWFLVYYSFINV